MQGLEQPGIGYCCFGQQDIYNGTNGFAVAGQNQLVTGQSWPKLSISDATNGRTQNNCQTKS